MSENKTKTPSAEAGQNETVDERVYKLSRPFTFEGTEYTELLLDFDSLTGGDLLSCEGQMNTMSSGNEVVPVKQISQAYQALVAARAAKVPVDLIKALPGKDFSKIIVRAQNFLLG